MSDHEPVILLCPCCASTLDADAGPDEQIFECISCGQNWSMVVSADRQTQHSLT